MEKPLRSPRVADVSITEAFFSYYMRLVRDKVIPYQWEILNDRVEGAEPSCAIRNMRRAAGLERGEFYGFVFQDSDLYKWIEAVAFSLEGSPDPTLEEKADYLVDLMEKAQCEDGYLDTYYILGDLSKRWTNVRDNHELYCAGHMFEAAAAYWDATGKRKLVDIACRFADHIDSVFGPEAGKLHGYPGHQVVEMGLMKLYRVTGNARYAELAAYFINQRGQSPNFFEEEAEKHGNRPFRMRAGEKFDYYQAHKPVREQKTVVGHAVRAVYLYSGMADVAEATGDEALLAACETLWDDMTTKQMQITGGVGASADGERFTIDYDLPLDSAYNETCASIGLIFFGQRLQKINRDAKYYDAIETALYNTCLAGMSLDGTRFFYVNPLEVWPERSRGNGTFAASLPTRPKWFACACCPPNLARLLMSLGSYIYSFDDHNIYANLFIGSEAKIPLAEGEVTIRCESSMPWDGKCSYRLSGGSAALHIRKPEWAKGVEFDLNGKPVTPREERGYFVFERAWSPNDTLEVRFGLTTEIVSAASNFRSMDGKLAVRRGPLVYCAEQADNGEGLYLYRLTPEMSIYESRTQGVLGDIVTITADAEKVKKYGDKPYLPAEKLEKTAKKLTLIPYYAWANRAVGEMQVWFLRA